MSMSNPLGYPIMSDDDFLQAIVNTANKFYQNNKTTKQMVQWLLPSKELILLADSPESLYTAWYSHSSIKVFQNRQIWEKWFNVFRSFIGYMPGGLVIDPPKLEIKEGQIYKLKSSDRRFIISDTDDKTVVIQFLDDKSKVDLPIQDFNNECQKIEEGK